MQTEYQKKMTELNDKLVTNERMQKVEETKEQNLLSELHTVRANLVTLEMEKDKILNNMCKVAEQHEDSTPHQDLQGAASLINDDTNRLVQEALDCVCCFEKMQTQVFQCAAGHLVCGDCYKKLTQCPCRSKYPKEPIRNRFAEQLAKGLK